MAWNPSELSIPPRKQCADRILSTKDGKADGGSPYALYEKAMDADMNRRPKAGRRQVSVLTARAMRTKDQDTSSGQSCLCTIKVFMVAAAMRHQALQETTCWQVFCPGTGRRTAKITCFRVWQCERSRDDWMPCTACSLRSSSDHAIVLFLDN
ncbi:hypothetical protein BDU57DRAFT_577005 [Ampelomyces quisqualis]|uniref:Uncharacterized protein n=1 Tax=Ampelomyces quisqualis TaxID=50730 RepID=A0A6A5QLN2_AMPQU|nr:hypothetical protein BDU57DRAFT_577005 [Ampelomyces quisqualis]